MLQFDLSTYLDVANDSPICSSTTLTSTADSQFATEEVEFYEILRDGESEFPVFNEDDLESNATVNDASVVDNTTINDDDDDDDSVISRSSSVSALSNTSKLTRKSWSKRNDIAIKLSHMDIKLDDMNTFDCKKKKCCFDGNCTRKLSIAEICETQKQFWGETSSVISTADRGEKNSTAASCQACR